MRPKTSLPPPPSGQCPRLVKHEDPFMDLLFNLGILACIGLLLFAGYRILSGY